MNLEEFNEYRRTLNVSDPAVINLGYEKIARDLYPSPEWIGYSLLNAKVIPKNYVIWEPAAGNGVLANAARESGYDVVSSDIHPNWVVNDFTFDFLKLKTGEIPYGKLQNCNRLAIWTNPPFGDRCKLAEKFIEHAIELTEPMLGMVVMLGRSYFDFARSRRHLFGESPIFAGRLNMSKRPRWIAGTTGAPRFNYSWYFWDWQKNPKENPIVLYDYYNGKDDDDD